MLMAHRSDELSHYLYSDVRRLPFALERRACTVRADGEYVHSAVSSTSDDVHAAEAPMAQQLCDILLELGTRHAVHAGEGRFEQKLLPRARPTLLPLLSCDNEADESDNEYQNKPTHQSHATEMPHKPHLNVSSGCACVRGSAHLKACCVVAGHLAERAWTVMHRGTPYVICDNNGNPVTAAEAKKIIAEKWTVPEDVRKRRRSRKTAEKALSRPQPGPTGEATPPSGRPGGPA